RYTAPPRAPNKAGANSFTWNLRYPEPVAFTGMILWAAGVFGPVAPPGSYTVKLSVGDKTESQTFKLLKDPRSSASQANLDDPFNYPIKLNNQIGALMGVVASAEAKPTAQSGTVFLLLSEQLAIQTGKLKTLLDTGLGPVNAELGRLGLPAVQPSTEEVAAEE